MYSRAILTLTNGLETSVKPTESTLLRLEKAASIYRNRDLIITSTGYTINKKPFLDDQGYPVLEAVISARYIRDNFDIPELDIMAESFSRDTIGNLFFSFQLFVLPLNIPDVNIVTSEFHMPRVQKIMELLSSIFRDYSTSISFVMATNPDHAEAVNDALQEREQNSIIHIEKLKERLQSAEAFTKWFYDEHRAYGYHVDPEPADTIIQKAY